MLGRGKKGGFWGFYKEVKSDFDDNRSVLYFALFLIIFNLRSYLLLTR